MSIFNPIIGDKNLHCRCQHCFHAFWLQDIDSAFKCYCQLSHSVIFGTGLDNIARCSGASDHFNFSEYSKNNVACTLCSNSLWLKSDKSVLRCICLLLQSIVLDSSNTKILPIAHCNGVTPLQELPDFPTATNLDDF